MAYDSEEQKKLAESIAKKTEMAYELFKDEESKERFMEELGQLNEYLKSFQEEQKHRPLAAQELEVLEELQATFQKTMVTINDVKLVLDNSISIAVTDQFFHVKRLAEEGNEEAKEAYEKLLPHFKEAMDPAATGKHNLN